MLRPLTTHSDPSGLWGSVVAVAAAILAALVAFGVRLTGEQVEALLGILAAVGPIVTALLIRRSAYAPATVDGIAARARHDGWAKGVTDSRRGTVAADVETDTEGEVGL